jgi:hypothetical protein
MTTHGTATASWFVITAAWPAFSQQKLREASHGIGKGDMNTNPFVWAITFRRIRQWAMGNTQNDSGDTDIEELEQ